MEKLLTISIAAYNAEEYIAQTLESLIIPQKMDILEVFVIDDGGTDGTLDIARKYQKMYPNTFIPVHKENGGYGTTVNYSIANATGKYFKLLDGDDWFDKEAFADLINVLETSTSDVIVTNYYKAPEGKSYELIETHKQDNGTTVSLKSGYSTDRPFDMWEIVCKTSILRESGLQLPAHVLYTDRYFATIPFSVADTVTFYDFPVYCYRIGRDGQSMSKESQVNRYKERLRGSLDLCSFYERQKNEGNPRCAYLKTKVAVTHVNSASIIKYMKKNKATKKILMEYEKAVERTSKDIVDCEKNFRLFGKFLTLCRKTNFILYDILPAVFYNIGD